MKLTKEIVSKDGAVHFRRWAVFETAFLRLYLHQILRADEDAHLHSHPWNFISWLIAGSYAERVKSGVVERKTGSLIHRSAEVHHQLASVSPGCLTLVLAYGRRREWGYDVDGQTVHHEEYRKRKREGHYD